jgi:aspartyl-tRNA(Asn)/glutamyl-tRNA(Gln) amidotransferase subunit C
MSGTAIIAARTDALLVFSGQGPQMLFEFQANLTATTLVARVETISSRRVASTYSKETKDLIHISTSATVPQWRRVARLARIAIDENEIIELCTQLNSIMSFVDQLSAVDVENVDPMTSVTPMVMKMRDDKVTDGGIADDILRNAPAHEDHFFVVPKVVE